MLKVKTNVLKEALNQLSVIYKPTTIIPQDSYCVFESLDDGQLKIRFANGDSEAAVWIKEVEIDKPINCLVHYNKLKTSINLMGSDIKLSFTDANVTVSDGQKTSRISIPDMSKMEYYPEYHMTDGVSLTLNGEEFITGINAVKDCTANKNKAVYTYLQGVLFDLKYGQLAFVAVTPKSAAVYQTSAKGTWKKDIIVPSEIVQAVAKWRGIESVKIEVNDTKIVFSSDSLRLSTTLLDGQFPNYTNLFEVKNSNTAKINREDLLSGLKFATNVGAVDKNPVIDVHIVEENGALRLKTCSSFNDATETELEATECEGLKVAFAGADIQRLIESCKDVVYMNYTPNLTSGKFFISSEDKNFQAVIVGLQFRAA